MGNRVLCAFSTLQIFSECLLELYNSSGHPKIYAESFGGKLYHYQDYAGKEIDAVVEMPDGRWAAFEIKQPSRNSPRRLFL